MENEEQKVTEYKDFDNLFIKIKDLIDESKNYKIVSCKNNEDNSGEFTVSNSYKKIHFELNFINFDSKNARTLLHLKFSNLNYKIYYTSTNNYIVLHNHPYDLNSQVFEDILNTEFKKSYNVKNAKSFPDFFSVQYYNDKAIYPIVTDFHCPVCQRGLLSINDDSQIRTEPYDYENKEINRKFENDYTLDWLIFSFAGYLICDKCSEKIAVIGDSYCSEPLGDEINNEYIYDQYFRIKYFERVKDFIKIDSLQNSELKEILRQSFKLYFCDKESCANKIRVFIEKFLTEIGVNETIPNGDFISLNQRIQSCKKLSESQKETLAILKNIGNSGSHSNNSISNEDLYKTYKVLEDIIAEYHHEEHVSDLKNDLKQHFSK